MSKIRESRGDRQLEVNAPYLSHPGDLCRVTGDSMLVEFASAVDTVTFAVGTRVARCLRFCETSLRRLLLHLETAAKLLKSLEGILSLFSKCALKSLIIKLI